MFIYAGREVDLATVLEDALAHAADDGGQFVATDMGMSLVEHAVVTTKMVEEFHDALHIAAFLAT